MRGLFMYFSYICRKYPFMTKKVSKNELVRQKQIAGNKIKAIDELISKGILSVDYKNYTATVNYLLWHSYSNVGLVNLANSLMFYCSIHRAYDGLTMLKEDNLHLLVDYGTQENNYEKLGVMPMVDFNSENGFKKIV